MKRKLKVYIADDHTLFRKAMAGLIQTFESVKEVKDAENGKELVDLVKDDQPDVVIVDMQMPVMDGVEACERLIMKYPEVKLIMLTMHDSEKYILHMIEMGVHAFLLSLGIEQAWTVPPSSHRSPLQVVRDGVEFGL